MDDKVKEKPRSDHWWRRAQGLLVGGLVLLAISAAAIAVALGISWQNERSSRDTLAADLRASEADVATAESDVVALTANNAKLSADARAATARYKKLRGTFDRAVKRERHEAAAAGFARGHRAVFAGYDEPWQTGTWYLVKIGPESGRLGLVRRLPVETDSQLRYFVEGDQVYTTRSLPPIGGSNFDAGTGFCATHSCIDNFDEGSGYPVQCADGMWSQSGGLSGACSWHGGVAGG